MKKFLSVTLALVISCVSLPALAETEPGTAKAQSLSPHGEYYGIPKVLSDDDVELYKKMFRFQRAGMRDKVVDLLPELSDGLLMGNLIAERLLHPTKRASYGDLKKWLSRYSDHGAAAQIYSLANSRKPRAEQHKKPEVLRGSIARYSDPDEEDIRDNVPNTNTRKKLLRNLKTYRQKQYYTKAMGELFKGANQAILGEDTWAQVSLKLTRAMMNDGYFKKANKMASKVVNTTELRKGDALWLAGFSAYMNGEKKVAASHFRRLAYAVPVESKYFAKGAFWAAKTYDELEENSIAKVFYNLASRDEDSFYGLVSAE